VSTRGAAGDVTDASEDEFLARLKAYEGRSAGAPTEGPDAVNQAMIRHWVEAMGDENPVYTDEAAARANGFPGVIAPPTMLQSWIMRGYKATVELAEARAAGRRFEGASPADELMHALDEGGFTSVVATDCEQEYLRPVVLGDRLSVSSSIESVSPEKQTALGLGHFITTLLRYTDQKGTLVATMRFRILKFRPGTGRPPAARSSAPPP
jgi:acyl dehydratase